MKLEALQANDGDCLLLHYGDGATSGLILIDGGSRGVYRNVLEKRLDELRAGKSVLNMRLVVVSHIDADHITGLLDMFREMSEQKSDGKVPRWKVGSLWHNAFEKTVGSHSAAVQSATVGAASAGSPNLDLLRNQGLQEKALAVVASVKQGKDLQRFATSLTRINAETDGKLIVAPKSGRTDIKIDKTLTFTILGPAENELDNLEEAWNKSKQAKVQEQSVAADYLNRTVPNLSSIVFLAEEKSSSGESNRILFTGDAGGDLILKGLEAANLLDDNHQIKVDVLKVQHHGSKHSVEQGFFEQVRADAYVISGNGAHGIPNLETLEWLSQARKGEPFHVYMTNHELVDKQKNYTTDLDNFLEEEKRSQPQHEYHFRQDSQLSITVTS